MKKNNIIIFLFCFTSLLAQKHDYLWTFGYDGASEHPYFEGTNIDFNSAIPTVTSSSRAMWIGVTNASVCDKGGNFLAFTNGIAVYNMNEEMVINGDSLNPGKYLEDFYESGYPIWYGAFFLPVPEKDSAFQLLHFGGEPGNRYKNFYHSLLDFTEKKQGTLINKNTLLYSGKFSTAAACKHGNGRDWWLIVPDNITVSRQKHLFLFYPDSIKHIKSQNIGSISNEGAPGGFKSGFSPDGSTFVKIDGFWGIEIFDFDRCSGELSNYRAVRFNEFDSWLAGNFEFSPNGRFLYFNTYTEVLQLDLLTDSIGWHAVDTVAVYDGHIEWNVGTGFNNQQLGPDGKIYISCPTTAPYLHIIHDPNEQGINCNVEQRAVRLFGRHSFSLPYFPNYRLGALEGSICDTLGVSSIEGTSQYQRFNLFPNPASDKVNVSINQSGYRNIYWELYDSFGKKIIENEIKNQPSFLINTTDMTNGVYFIRAYLDSKFLGTQKFIIQR